MTAVCGIIATVAAISSCVTSARFVLKVSAIGVSLSCYAFVMAVKRITDVERFSQKLAVDEFGCWRWQAGKSTNGYGRFAVGSRTDQTHYTEYAHRWIYIQVYGDIPAHWELDHLCRVRCCVNPYHLEAVPHITNVRRGEVAQWQRLKTHCPAGHAYSDNTYLTKKGSRTCATCVKARTHRYKAMVRGWRASRGTRPQRCDRLQEHLPTPNGWTGRTRHQWLRRVAHPLRGASHPWPSDPWHTPALRLL